MVIGHMGGFLSPPGETVSVGMGVETGIGTARVVVKNERVPTKNKIATVRISLLGGGWAQPWQETGERPGESR